MRPMRRPLLRASWWVLALGLVGCDSGQAPPVDQGVAPPPDARPRPDARLRDAAPDVDDARPADRGPADGGPLDQGAQDMGLRDMGLRDMGAQDMGLPDQGDPLDQGLQDQGVLDAALPDMAAGPREACFNGLDDDGDGRTDCADPDCRRSGACFDQFEDCENGLDDNGDDRVDCDDVRCLQVCPPSAAGPMQEAEIQAVFDQACNVCHGAAALALLDLRAPFTADSVGVPSSEVRGLRIAPGSRADSYLYRKLAFTFREVPGGGGEGMPPLPDVSLPAETVDRIGQWIDALEP